MSNKLYDEKIWSQEDRSVGGGEDIIIDHSYRVRLFKEKITDPSVLKTDQFPIYLLVEEHEIYDSTKTWPTGNGKKKVYVSGSDSDHIRKAIALIDKFKDESANTV